MVEDHVGKLEKPYDLTIVASVLLFMLLIVKAYGVAGFSLTTATAIVGAAPLSVLTGIITLYSYAFMALIAALSLWLMIVGLRLGDSRSRSLVPLTFLVWLFASLLSPWHYLVDAVLCTAFILMPYYVLRQSQRVARIYVRLTRSRMLPSAPRVATLAGLTLAMLFALVTISKPWLPAQVVTLDRPLVGNSVHPNTSVTRQPVVFIVSEGNGQVSMLLDEDRYVVSVPEQDVKARRICHLNDQLPGQDPLFETLLGQHYQPHDLSC